MMELKMSADTHCQVCEAGHAKTGKYGIFRFEDSDYSLLECTSCHCLFSNPNPSNEVLHKYYNTSFAHEWYRAFLPFKRKDAKERVRQYKKYLGGSCLDFGGNAGYFADVCKENGISSITFDPYNPLKSLPSDKKFDSVVASHVLEHSNNLNDTIDEMTSKLKSGGYLLVSVPNLESEAYKIHGMASTWAQPPVTHIFHFNAEGLAQAFSRKGLRVVDTKLDDRWDCNYLADVKYVKLTRKFESLWHHFPKNPWRRIGVKITGSYRFLMLWLSRIARPRANNSELTIICQKI